MKTNITKLQVGQEAPDFSLRDQEGVPHTLSDYKGSWTIVYFYPKDDTPGCTTEACTIAEIYSDFSELGVDVFGISKDSVESHKKFAQKYHLPFTLLSDKGQTVAERYGVWAEKEMFGKKHFGIVRTTFLIDTQGKIHSIFTDVDPATHALELIAAVRAAQNLT